MPPSVMSVHPINYTRLNFKFIPHIEHTTSAGKENNSDYF